jgi:hypothetical protein
MNRILIPTIATALFGVHAAFADVPSLINYQGRLTDAAGAPVTGAKNFAISIYDAATAGNTLYTETIGAVTLDANGVYSFQFGGAGTSNTLVSEAIATTDGTLTTFQKVLANSPVVEGTVSVTDGTYTWTQSGGSSNEDDFGVAYSTSLRRVTVNYYAGAPAAGMAITATYRYGTSGITGALSSGAEHWMAISVDGTVQGTRQRILAVPFALRAAKSDMTMGDYVPCQDGTVYQAKTNGFICASAQVGDVRNLNIYVGEASTSMPLVWAQTSGPYNTGLSVTLPIKKGMYWKSQYAGTLLFISLE